MRLKRRYCVIYSFPEPHAACRQLKPAEPNESRSRSSVDGIMIYDAFFRVNLGGSLASDFILAFNSVSSNGSSVLLLIKAFPDWFAASFVSSFV